MKKSVFVFCLLIKILSAGAQHFEWAASMGTAETKVITSVTDKQGNSTMLVEYGSYEYKPVKTKEIYDGNGNAVKVDWMDHFSLLLIQVDPKGNIAWYKEIADVAGDENYYLAIGPDNVRYLLVNSRYFVTVWDTRMPALAEKQNIKNTRVVVDNEEEDEDEDDDEEGGDDDDHPTLFKDYFMEVPYKHSKNLRGLVCIGFSETGVPVSFTKILPAECVDVTGFQATADGFAISAEFEGNTTIKGKLYLEGEGDCIIRTDTSFNIKWVQQIKSVENGELLTYYTRVACNPVGTAYMVGMAQKGVVLPSGEKTVFESSKQNSEPNGPVGHYIVAFDNNGKEIWNKTFTGRTFITTMYADDKQVYVSGVLKDNDIVFGKKLDTTRERRGFIMAFDNIGNVRWYYTGNYEGFAAITTDNDGTMYALAEFTGNRESSFGSNYEVYESDTFYTRYSHSGTLIASYSPDGRYRWGKMLSPLVFDDAKTPVSLGLDDCHNLYVTTSAFCGGMINDLDIEDVEIKGILYGSMAYCAKLKNNTLPIKQDKTLNTSFTYRQAGAGLCNEAVKPVTVNLSSYQFPNTTTVTVNIPPNEKVKEIWVLDIKKSPLKKLSTRKLGKDNPYSFVFNPAQEDIKKGKYFIRIVCETTVATSEVFWYE